MKCTRTGNILLDSLITLNIIKIQKVHHTGQVQYTQHQDRNIRKENVISSQTYIFLLLFDIAFSILTSNQCITYNPLEGKSVVARKVLSLDWSNDEQDPNLQGPHQQ